MSTNMSKVTLQLPFTHDLPLTTIVQPIVLPLTGENLDIEGELVNRRGRIQMRLAEPTLAALLKWGEYACGGPSVSLWRRLTRYRSSLAVSDNSSGRGDGLVKHHGEIGQEIIDLLSRWMWDQYEIAALQGNAQQQFWTQPPNDSDSDPLIAAHRW